MHGSRIEQGTTCLRIAWEDLLWSYILCPRLSRIGTTECVDVRPVVCANSYSIILCSLYHYRPGWCLAFSSFLSFHCARRRSAGSTDTLAFLPASSSCPCTSYLSCLSLFFLPLLFLLEIRASHTAGRKSRNRLAENPPLARDSIDLAFPKRGIGEVHRRLVTFLSRIAYVHTLLIFTLGCGSL